MLSSIWVLLVPKAKKEKYFLKAFLKLKFSTFLHTGQKWIYHTLHGTRLRLLDFQKTFYSKVVLTRRAKFSLSLSMLTIAYNLLLLV